MNGLKGKWRTQSARITPNENSRHENKPAVEEQIKAEPLANSQWVEVEYEPAEEVWCACVCVCVGLFMVHSEWP